MMLTVEVKAAPELLAAILGLTKAVERLGSPMLVAPSLPPPLPPPLSRAAPPPPPPPPPAQSAPVAVAPRPAPLPPQPVATGTPWTPERKEVMRRRWPAGHPVGDIRVEMEALPGPPVPNNAIVGVWAANNGLKRPKQEPPTPISRLEALARVAVSAAGHPVVANFAQVERWAAERGIQLETRDDLPKVNAKRIALGLSPFSIPEVR